MGLKALEYFKKQTNLFNRPNVQLEEKHQIYLLDFYDKKRQARLVDEVGSLTKPFANFTLKKSRVHNFLKTECNLSLQGDY